MGVNRIILRNLEMQGEVKRVRKAGKLLWVLNRYEPIKPIIVRNRGYHPGGTVEVFKVGFWQKIFDWFKRRRTWATF